MSKVLVITSKVKEVARAGGLRTSAEFVDALSEHVGEVIIKAAMKAKADKRGTIKARDLPDVSFD